ncbi:MAG: recombinase RecT [Candidatus Paceibacteria bacterium]
MLEALKFSDAEKAVFRAAYAPAGATDEQWNLFINECQRRALVPGKDVIFQLRSSKEYDKDLKRDIYVKKVTFITTIGGLRLIAQRDGHYEGHGPFIYYYGTEEGDLKESKIPLGKIPHAVSVEGFRKDWRVPMFATARYAAYVQTYGKDGEAKKPTLMWATRGEEQLAKCCEAGMLRTVAPEECAGLLINEELGNDGVIDKEEIAQPVTAAVVPLPIQAPAVNQTAQAVYEPITPPSLHTAPIEQPLPVPVSSTPVPVSSTAPPDVPLPSEPEEVSPNVQQEVTKPTALLVPIHAGEFEKEDGNRFPPMTALPITTPAPVSADANTPATQKERDAFLGRAAKLVRDKLPKGGMKDQAASNGVKDFLLKTSGKAGFKQMTASDWEKSLSVLERTATPEDAVAIVKAAIAK